jgi:hypothetical protein
MTEHEYRLLVVRVHGVRLDCDPASVDEVNVVTPHALHVDDASVDLQRRRLLLHHVDDTV